MHRSIPHALPPASSDSYHYRTSPLRRPGRSLVYFLPATSALLLLPCPLTPPPPPPLHLRSARCSARLQPDLHTRSESARIRRRRGGVFPTVSRQVLALDRDVNTEDHRLGRIQLYPLLCTSSWMRRPTRPKTCLCSADTGSSAGFKLNCSDT